MQQAAWWATDPNQPSTLMKIWCEKIIPPEIQKEFTTEDYNVLTRACVGYLLNIYPFTEMVRMLKYKDEVVKPYTEEKQAFKFWLNLRTQLVSQGEALLGIKLLLMRCVAKEMNGAEANLEQELKACELLPNDAALFTYLNDMCLRLPLEMRLPHIPADIPTVKQVRKDCAVAIGSNIDYTNKYVNRKLRFVITSNNYETYDLSGDIFFATTTAYYLKVPFLSKEHLNSMVKMTIRNHGQKVRKFYTASSRARLRKSSDGGWENLVITNSTFKKNDDAEDSGINHVNTSMGLSGFADLETRMVLNQFAKKSDPTTLKIVQLLCAQDDSRFLEFVKKEADDCVIQSTLDIIDRLGNEQYYRYIAKYLSIKNAAVYAVISELRQLLSGNNTLVKYQGRQRHPDIIAA